MRRFLSKSLMMVVLGALVIALVLTAGHSVRAQDGLSDEELATLDRLEAAYENFTTYTSYTAHSVQLDSQAITVSIAGLNIAITETTNRELNITFIEVDGEDNIHADGIVTVVASDTSTNTESDYTLEAEVRLVDGTLYVMVASLDSEGDVPTFPEGWVEVGDANISQFEILDIADLLEGDETEDSVGLDEDDLFADREMLESLVESVTVDPMELEDGTPVDLVTLTMRGEGLADFMGDDLDLGLDEATMAEFMGMLFEGVDFNLQIALDADDNVRQTTFTLTVNVEDIDASIIPDVPEGMDATFSMMLEMVETTTYSDINADLEPVEAPE